MQKIKDLIGRLAGVRRIIFGAAIVLAAILLIAWLSGAFGSKIAPDPTVGTAELDIPAYSGFAEVVSVDIPISQPVSGRILPLHEAQVAAQVMERIIAVNVQAGQQVKKGDLLVKLDDTVLRSRAGQAQAAKVSAQAARDQAQRDLQNIKNAFDRGAATQTELDRAQTAMLTTQADLQLAEKSAAEAVAMLEFTDVRSPMDGTVIDKQVEVGSTAKQGQVLVTIYDRMQMIADVPESLASNLRVGQEVAVEVEQLKLKCGGQVSEIVPESDPVSRTFPVKVTGPCHPEVRKGMYAKLYVPVKNEQIIGVPPSAIWKTGQLDVAYVSDGQSLRRQVVRLGKTVTLDDGRTLVEILAGLQAGQKVAVRQVTINNVK